MLCARCEYLHAMFDPDSNWRESRQAEVPVDVDGHVFRCATPPPPEPNRTLRLGVRAVH